MAERPPGTGQWPPAEAILRPELPHVALVAGRARDLRRAYACRDTPMRSDDAGRSSNHRGDDDPRAPRGTAGPARPVDRSIAPSSVTRCAGDGHNGRVDRNDGPLM